MKKIINFLFLISIIFAYLLVGMQSRLEKYGLGKSLSLILTYTFFLLIGCTSNTSTSTKVSCPDVFFAAEHSKYIDSNIQPISIDNLSYKAYINNYAFNSDCLILDNIIQVELSLLFIVSPYQVEARQVSLPFYIAILNEINEVVDMQYYLIEGDLKTDPKTKKYIENFILFYKIWGISCSCAIKLLSWGCKV